MIFFPITYLCRVKMNYLTFSISDHEEREKNIFFTKNGTDILSAGCSINEIIFNGKLQGDIFFNEL